MELGGMATVQRHSLGIEHDYTSWDGDDREQARLSQSKEEFMMCRGFGKGVTY